MNDRIVIDPEIQHGKPVIRGTRVPVARVVGGLAGGMTPEEIMREYDISLEDVRAALEYLERRSWSPKKTFNLPATAWPDDNRQSA